MWCKSTGLTQEVLLQMIINSKYYIKARKPLSLEFKIHVCNGKIAGSFGLQVRQDFIFAGCMLWIVCNRYMP